jgi:hypothetical protein
MVILDVDDPKLWYNETYINGPLSRVLAAPFIEPDRNNEMTAVAFLPENGVAFKDLKLMKC